MADKAKDKTPEAKTRAVEHSPQLSERISRALLAHVKDIADSCEAAAVLITVDTIGNLRDSWPDDFKQKVLLITQKEVEPAEFKGQVPEFIHIPDVPLTRLGQMKVAVFLAHSRGILTSGEVIVCLTGTSGGGTLDTLIVTQIGHEFELLSLVQDSDPLPPDVKPEVIERVVAIATELGIEGREGKPVGTMFVIGDSETVLTVSRQLILNPFRGYPEQERNILDPLLEETVKELSSLDGAFVIRGDGIIESCGTYLMAASQPSMKLPGGLGARHQAGAAITGITQSLCITVSESTGTVTIFRHGKIVTEIEKPRQLGKVPRTF